MPGDIPACYPDDNTSLVHKQLVHFLGPTPLLRVFVAFFPHYQKNCIFNLTLINHARETGLPKQNFFRSTQFVLPPHGDTG